MESHPSDPKFHIQTHVTINYNEVSQTLLIRLPWAYSDMGSPAFMGHTRMAYLLHHNGRPASLHFEIIFSPSPPTSRVRLVEIFFLSNRST